MKIVKTAGEHVQVSLSRDDLMIINAALNEVCNGIDVFEFSTRMGADRSQVAALLKEVGTLISKMKSDDI